MVILNLPVSAPLSFNPIFIVSFQSELIKVTLIVSIAKWFMLLPVSLTTTEILPTYACAKLLLLPPSQGTPQLERLTELPPWVILTIAFISIYAVSYDPTISPDKFLSVLIASEKLTTTLLPA